MSNLELSAPIPIASQVSSPQQIFTTLGSNPDSTVALLNGESLVLKIEVSEITCQLVLGQGPSGPPGGSGGEEEMKYAKRTDFVGTDVVYKGEATPGSLETSPAWRISRITFIAEDSVEEWANGNANFVNMWSQRAALPYS